MMSDKIDINVADVETLATISGIGSVLAERIIEYRQTVHPFEEVIELAAVPGISEKMVRGFEALVTVQPATRGTAVPLNLDEPEETPLLAAPDEMILLEAPEQPEALLEPPNVEEIVVAEADEMADSAEDAMAQGAVEETAPEKDDPPLETEPDVAFEPETAVPPSPPPAAVSPSRPEPDLTMTPPAPQNGEWDTKSQRRGCLNTLLGATFGAILGAVLTLAILAAINNGTLTYSASDSEIRQQINTEIISRTNELNQLSTRVSLVATEEAAANQTLQDTFVTANDALTEEVTNNEENISYLATRSGELAVRLEEVAGAADTFTDFLDGLRLLLDDLGGGTATPTTVPENGTLIPTATPVSSSTATVAPSATATVSPTVAPTRTPLPTATPFSFPTNTPAPQP
jgi:competence ComEA-like helix-hairpin-helix protein